MKLVKYNPFKPFNSVGIDQFFDDLNSRSISDFFGSDFVNATPSVNVIENDDSFMIELAAPGLSKEDFQIEIDNDRLVVSAEKETSSVKEEGKYTRKEFGYNSFKRSFHLTEDIYQDDVDASYSDGVLSITLKKKEEDKNIKRTVEVA